VRTKAAPKAPGNMKISCSYGSWRHAKQMAEASFLLALCPDSDELLATINTFRPAIDSLCNVQKRAFFSASRRTNSLTSNLPAQHRLRPQSRENFAYTSGRCLFSVPSTAQKSAQRKCRGTHKNPKTFPFSFEIPSIGLVVWHFSGQIFLGN
jgi:hypothetical protein